nr:(d)CMP kinase [Deinobacterium chartae]
MIITIDGVAASGKSSVARRVAEELRLPFVSSGLLYRAATVLALRESLDLSDGAALLAALEHFSPRLIPDAAGNRVLVGTDDLTGALHTAEVDAHVSQVSQHPPLRRWVREQLRLLPPPFVVEGRDMGSAVFPEAAVKYYLTARPEVRARRRGAERDLSVEQIEWALRERDRQDAAQSAPAEGAVLLDTSDMNLEQVVERILEGVRAWADR